MGDYTDHEQRQMDQAFDAAEARRTANRKRLGGHTPGPWALEAPDSVSGPSRCEIARLRPPHFSEDVADTEQQLANGRLIAAAPDLLDVVHEAFHLSERMPAEWVVKARALLAKIAEVSRG